MDPSTFLVVGAGSRGATYAGYALERPDEMAVVGVAEPREFHRRKMATDHAVPEANVCSDWREAAARERMADAVIIATRDDLHAEPAIAFAKRGYHILLEKPMAPTEGECTRIVASVLDAGVTFAVCHVMRYTHYARRIRKMIDDGLIGDVVSVQHYHPVGFWHQAHSFVRGNWGNEARSGPMLLTKACHDVDLLRFFVGSSCTTVSSFGSLTHFRSENAPAGAADRCVNCSVEPDCAYSAPKIYGRWLARGETGWPLDTIAPTVTPDTIEAALQAGPYGRCVYACDNDVVDHQVVAFEYERNRTATLTMNAFNKDGGVVTRIFGTRGEIYLDGGVGRLEGGKWHMQGAMLRRYDFLTDEFYDEDPYDVVDTRLSGHGNGDFHLINHFVAALRSGDRRWILSGPEVTLETHRTVFAAERSRLERRTVHI